MQNIQEHYLVTKGFMGTFTLAHTQTQWEGRKYTINILHQYMSEAHREREGLFCVGFVVTMSQTHTV